MRTIICGGRDYAFTNADYEFLNRLHEEHRFTQVISGSVRGADMHGEIWARLNAVPLHIERADWNAHGKSAGPIRNSQMANMADACVAFPGGRGTADMIAKAEAKGLRVIRRY